MRISKVITRTGDEGKTGLGDGQRVYKNDPRIDCIGSIDELNSFIGFVNVAIEDREIVELLESIQNDLFNIGGSLSMPDVEMDTIDEKCINKMEQIVSDWNTELPPLKEFILPGGNEASARVHLLRSHARKTERKIIGLHQTNALPKIWLQYFNRLSDVFFVLARKLQHDEGVDEKQWERK